MFLLTHFWLIVASVITSLIVLCLAGADKGRASFYLMILTPILTIIHHTIILFLPSYRPSHLEFEASPKGATFSKQIPPPTHTEPVYLAFLILISVMWSMSVMTAFYVMGWNFGSGIGGIVKHTGPAECAFGIIETGISWAIFVLCVNQRIFRYDCVPSA